MEIKCISQNGIKFKLHGEMLQSESDWCSILCACVCECVKMFEGTSFAHIECKRCTTGGLQPEKPQQIEDKSFVTSNSKSIN